MSDARDMVTRRIEVRREVWSAIVAEALRLGISPEDAAALAVEKGLEEVRPAGEAAARGATKKAGRKRRR